MSLIRNASQINSPILLEQIDEEIENTLYYSEDKIVYRTLRTLVTNLNLGLDAEISADVLLRFCVTSLYDELESEHRLLESDPKVVKIDVQMGLLLVTPEPSSEPSGYRLRFMRPSANTSIFGRQIHWTNPRSWKTVEKEMKAAEARGFLSAQTLSLHEQNSPESDWIMVCAHFVFRFYP